MTNTQRTCYQRFGHQNAAFTLRLHLCKRQRHRWHRLNLGQRDTRSAHPHSEYMRILHPQRKSCAKTPPDFRFGTPNHPSPKSHSNRLWMCCDGQTSAHAKVDFFSQNLIFIDSARPKSLWQFMLEDSKMSHTAKPCSLYLYYIWYIYIYYIYIYISYIYIYIYISYIYIIYIYMFKCMFVCVYIIDNLMISTFGPLRIFLKSLVPSTPPKHWGRTRVTTTCGSWQDPSMVQTVQTQGRLPDLFSFMSRMSRI